LWGSTPMMTFSIDASAFPMGGWDGEVGIATTSWAIPS
jgi:hypothetical protein